MSFQHPLFPWPPPRYSPAQSNYGNSGNSGGVGYNYRGMQEGFYRRPRGESHTIFGAAGHMSFMQANNAAFQNAGGILPQDSRSSYPLPQPLEQPQYSQQYAYAQPAPRIPAAIAHSLPGPAVGFEDGGIQLYSMQPQAMPYDFGTPYHNGSNFPQQPKYNSPTASRPQSQGLPLLMGPPIWMGFRSSNDIAVDHPTLALDQIKSQTLHHGVPQARHHEKSSLQPFRRTSHDASSSANDSLGPPKQTSRGRKRPHDVFAEAEQFEIKRKSEHATRTLVGLGMPIPVKPPTSREKEKLSKKKTRRHNQLGLNPRTVKRESSEGDNGVDEEVKLAVVASLPTAEPIDIRYKGEISRLKSASDIAAWIEERRKRFPTKAKRENLEHRRKLEEKLQASRRALAEAETAKQMVREARNDGEDAKEEAEVLLKLKDLKRRLRKQQRQIRTAKAKILRSKSEANHGGAGDFAPATAQESKRLDRSAGDKGVTARGNTDIIKNEGADPLVLQVSTPPVQEDQSIADGETARGHAKQESEYEKDVVSPIPTHSPLISASKPSLRAPSDRIEELPLLQDAQQLRTEPSRSPCTSTVHTAEPRSNLKQSGLLDTDRASLLSND